MTSVKSDDVLFFLRLNFILTSFLSSSHELPDTLTLLLEKWFENLDNVEDMF